MLEIKKPKKNFPGNLFCETLTVRVDNGDDDDVVLVNIALDLGGGCIGA